MFKSIFNINHFLKVHNARKDSGLYVNLYGDNIPDHPLIGKSCFKNSNPDKIYTIKKVVKNWHCGYYITLLADDINNSSTCIIYFNLNSINPDIINTVEKNNLIWNIKE